MATATHKQAEEAVVFFPTMERRKFTPKTRALYYLLIRANVSSRNIKPLLDQICELLGVRHGKFAGATTAKTMVHEMNALHKQAAAGRLKAADYNLIMGADGASKLGFDRYAEALFANVAGPGTDIVSEVVNVSDMAGKDAGSHADTTEATYSLLAKLFNVAQEIRGLEARTTSVELMSRYVGAVSDSAATQLAAWDKVGERISVDASLGTTASDLAPVPAAAVLYKKGTVLAVWAPGGEDAEFWTGVVQKTVAGGDEAATLSWLEPTDESTEYGTCGAYEEVVESLRVKTATVICPLSARMLRGNFKLADTERCNIMKVVEAAPPEFKKFRCFLHKVRAAQGWLSALSVFNKTIMKSILYGAFVWARRALNRRVISRRRFWARAGYESN